MMETSLPDALEVVSFMAGGYRFAVEAEQVRTQLSAKNSATVPTAEQLLGLAGEETQTHGSRRTLLMKHPAGDYAVTVSDPVELLGLRVDAIYPLPSLIAARNTLVGIRGLAIGAEGVTMLVDFRAARPAVL
jgi:hypothetical protein